MISKMSRVEIVGPISLFDTALYSIQDEGVLHMEPIPLAESPEKGMLHRVPLTREQEEERDALENLDEMLHDAVGHIPEQVTERVERTKEYRDLYARWEGEDVAAISVAGRSLHAKVRSLIRRRRNLADDLHVLGSYEEVVVALAPLVETHELPSDYEFTGIILDQRDHTIRELFKKELRKLTGGEYRYFEANLSNRRVAALVGYPKHASMEVRSFIVEAGIGQMNVPRYLRDKPFEQALAELEDDIEELRAKQRKLDEQIEAFYSSRAAELLALHRVAQDRYSRYKATSHAAVTRYTFLIHGWLPRENEAPLRKRLFQLSDGSIVFRRLQIPRTENPPVRLQNPKAVTQFEPLLGLFPLPRYGTIDPTLSVATVFPPIFGLMLADIGYGILAGIGAILVRWLGRAKKLARQLSFVLGACAVFTIIFGFVFGEFFGEIGKSFGLHPLWQERFAFTGPEKTKTLLGYMAIALAIGIVHVLFGLVLGVINSGRTGDRSGMAENLAKIFGVFVLMFFVGRLANLLPPIFNSAVVVSAVIFLVLMGYQVMHRPTHGFVLPLEVLGTIGNILSYVRIMAIGLVSVVLAFLANLFGGMMPSLLLGVIVAVLIHALNLALGIIDPTIQGLRLHYVEFFSKFFMGGGAPYSPLKKIGGVSA